MNRQQRRNFERKLYLSGKEIDNLAEHFRHENEVRNQAVVVEFLSLTIEALRLEFGFGQKRIDRYTKKVDELLDSVNLGYLSFEDLLGEIGLSSMQVVKFSEESRTKILNKIERKRDSSGC